jgi:ADP-heptose:LPS heptosyltransferase
MERRFYPLRTWQDYLNAFGDDIIYIESNEHLGQGRPLKDWLPDLEPNYHFKFNLKDENLKFHINSPSFGFHTASIQGIRNWNAWMPETWVEFLQLVHKEFPDFTFVALGGYWDLDTIQEIKGMLKDDFPLIDLVGKTTISDAIRILDRLDYYVGFSSGLNCIRNVLNKPCAVLWPKHQRELIWSHPDPETIERRDYLGFTYDSPDRIFNRIKPKLKEVLYTKTLERAVV